MKSTGVFTCQKPGLYLISVNVMSDSTAGSVRITNNDYAIAAGFFSISDHNVTTSATVITRLDVNDKVAVISSSEMHVYGGDPSCLNIVQFQWSRWSLIKKNIVLYWNKSCHIVDNKQ